MGLEAATPPGFWERVVQIVQTEVGKLLRSGLLRNASISDGGLTIKGGFLRLRAPGAVADTFFVGGSTPNLPDGSPQPVMQLRRNDGTVALEMYDPIPSDGYAQFLAWRDRIGNIVFSDDTDSGRGLARPWLPIPLYPGLGVTSLPASTTSGSFTALWIARTAKQQPRLAVGFLASAPAGTTAEVRVTVGSTQIGPTITVTGGSLGDTTIQGLVDGAHMAEMRVNLEARLVSGAGPVTVYPVRCEGRQS